MCSFYQGRRYKKCAGKSSKRLIKWQRHLRRFLFIFAVCFLNEKQVNLVFCVLCVTFFIAAFMSEVLVISSPRIMKKAHILP